jgi:hypothetical protein
MCETIRSLRIYSTKREWNARSRNQQQKNAQWGEWQFIRDEKLLEHASGYRVDFKQMNTLRGHA